MPWLSRVGRLQERPPHVPSRGLSGQDYLTFPLLIPYSIALRLNFKGFCPRPQQRRCRIILRNLAFVVRRLGESSEAVD